MIHIEETGLVQFLLPEYHYKSVFDISMKKNNGTPRDVDDFLPRPNITKRIEEGSLKLED